MPTPYPASPVVQMGRKRRLCHTLTLAPLVLAALAIRAPNVFATAIPLGGGFLKGVLNSSVNNNHPNALKFSPG
jgi:hypothetical protein